MDTSAYPRGERLLRGRHTRDTSDSSTLPDSVSRLMPYSSQTHARRWMNFLNAQKLCVFSFTLTDQCASSTSGRSPTYTVATPSSSYSRSTRSRTSAFCAWSRRFVRCRYSRRIRFEGSDPRCFDCRRAISSVVSWNRPEQLTTVVEVLVPSSRGTRDEIVRSTFGRLLPKPVVNPVENQVR